MFVFLITLTVVNGLIASFYIFTCYKKISGRNGWRPHETSYSINGTKYWFLNDNFHRKNGPAIIRDDGSKEWYLNGYRHRENGPAIECSNGEKHWYLNGNLHRENGPAVERSDGTKLWYKNGHLHRTDGPAIEKGKKSEWWVNGKQQSKKHRFASIDD